MRALGVFVFEKGLEIFLLFRLSENPACLIALDLLLLEQRLEFLAEICHFPVPDRLGAGNDAIVRLARGVVATVFTDMKIAVAMRTCRAKPDLDSGVAQRLGAFPAKKGLLHFISVLHGRSCSY